jgi:predicted transglutaminase-like cysteine proteinase
MHAALPDTVRGNFARLVAGVVIGACVLAAPAATSATLPQSGKPVPFGMESEPVSSGVAAKWRAVEVDLDAEQHALAACRTGAACPAAAQGLLDIIAEGAGRVGLARVGLINRAVDLAIAPASDEVQWGVADHWSPPFETLETRRGDCEDYAIVKYLALLEAGLSRNDVKIVIVRNLLPNEDHAVVAARVDGEWLILDNRRLALVHDTEMVGSIPKFVLDEDGARRLIPSKSDRAGPGTGPSSARRLLRPA